MINLTIESLNAKNITVIDGNQVAVANMTQNVQSNLTYDNLILNVHTANTLSMENLKVIAFKPLDDFIYIFIVIMLFMLVTGMLWMFRRRR